METTGAFPIQNSHYYHFWQKEKAAIDEHKWFLSEQSGRDVGIHFAQWDWIMGGHRTAWIKKLKERGEYPLN